MQLDIFQVDAFTAHPFKGNPAAVCLLPAERDEIWLQSLAAEMNLSETAFLLWQRGGFNLRWFTPRVEVALCGHATLASAHILWEEEYVKPDKEAVFHTLSGQLTARKDGDWIELNFPAKTQKHAEAPSGLLEALGIKSSEASYVGRNDFDYLVEVTDEKIVQSLQPNFGLLGQIDMRGVMVTARSSSSDYDFISRFFGPRVGVNEDPVTGSAHCCLAPYWAEKLGKETMLGYQASERGGFVRVRPSGDRVFFSGQAVTIFRGTLAIPAPA